MSGNEVTDSTIQSDPVANEDDEEFSTLTPDNATTSSKPDFVTFQSAAATNLNKISDLKKVHLDEITDLRVIIKYFFLICYKVFLGVRILV